MCVLFLLFFMYGRIENNFVMAVQDDREQIIDAGTSLDSLLPSFAFDICSDSVCASVHVQVLIEF